jgi:hypothetical protein
MNVFRLRQGSHNLFTGLSTARAKITVLEAKLEHAALHIAQLEAKLEKMVQVATTSEARALRIELDNVTALVEQLRTANRKEFGKLWIRLRGDRQPDEAGAVDSDDFQAMLDLQSRQN